MNDYDDDSMYWLILLFVIYVGSTKPISKL